MDSSSSSHRPSLPAVPASLLLLVALCAGLWWWLRPDTQTGKAPPPSGLMGTGILEPFRVPGGSLQTNGITKAEELYKEKGTWRGTTTSGISLNATYRYEIELRADWNIHIDEERRIAFVVAPEIKPQLPVAVDSQSVQEKTESGWGRFDKWEHLRELREAISPLLEEKANSQGYKDLARGHARQTVEEFVSDWILKHRPWPEGPPPVIKVYFADEDDIPYPKGRSLKDFLP